jgi:hypothetical protein
MAASDNDIRRLRRMVGEMTDSTYNDTDIATYLETWPLVDKNGLTFENDSWEEAYDLHAAAAEIWDEKAAIYAPKHDFSADGANFSSSQMYAHALKQSKHHRALQKAQVKRQPIITRTTYYPEYENPIFDEDEYPDWIDNIV